MPSLGEWGPLVSNVLAIVLVMLGALVWIPKWTDKTIPAIIKQRSEEMDEVLEHARQERLRQEERHAQEITRLESRIDNLLRLWDEKTDAKLKQIVFEAIKQLKV